MLIWFFGESVLMFTDVLFRKSLACLGLGLLLLVSLAVRAEPREIDWLELMPAEDLALLETMPEIEHEGDGPPLLPDEIMTGRVVPEMGNVQGRIPGFVVPLKTTDDMRILEFFLVPYYGACIHVPPPPPNQIIHVKYHEGFTLEALYDPVWIEGELVIERTENDLGTSSYSMVAQSVEPYTE
ncbi:hypothetical protein Q672_05920 [Marinobacter sp. EVN1]|nr:hypothetical protein Q672_05920 [Marinobacter sp. EVN1]